MPPPDFSPWIASAREHPTLTALLGGLLFVVLVLAALPKPHPGRRIVGVMFAGYLIFPIALLFLAKAVAAGALGPDAANWLKVPAETTSPEAAYGCLAFAAVAILALARNTGLRAAAVVGPAIYTMAPLLAQPPTMEGLVGHAVELTIVFLGAVLLLLQVSIDRLGSMPTIAASEPVAAE